MRLIALAIALVLLAGPAVAIDRVGVRVVGSEGEFYTLASGKTFVPRGVNYLDFRPISYGREDRVLGVGVFDPQRIAEAFETLGANGYNSVRVFFDHCSDGRNCIVDKDGRGLNPAYMDNMAAFTRIAAEHDIHVMFTSNDIPDFGGYGEMANRDSGPMVAGYRNAHFMTGGGVAAFKAYWGDLMAALKARDTAWEAVLGWSILNEEWIFKNQPPWSLKGGIFVNGTGKSYDLADRAQKRAALIDNLVLISKTVRDRVKAADPQALVTMGFFAPQFPVSTGIGGDWYVDTEPLLGAAPLDFFDFHAYVDMDIGIHDQAKNFGMPAHRDRPAIMGEVGSSPAFIPRMETALRGEQEWMAQSCDEGFDGWLHWGYYPFPPGMDAHPPYTFLTHSRRFLDGLSPRARPDPCLKGDYEPYLNLAREALATASRSLPGHGPELALDERETTWETGADAPGWIDIALKAPGRLGEVTLWLEQWPAGETEHRVVARLSNGTRLLVADHVAATAGGDKLVFRLPGGVPDVISVRVEIVRSPSWVSLHDIELERDRGEGSACLLLAPRAVNLRGDPSTSKAPVGRLPTGFAALGTAKTAGEDGHDWYSLSLGGYVRADVVKPSTACSAL